MQLKSLQIQGFKSFPDKTELIFGRGLTAVVGPNGSGKSNISDAVRWVLGEQSTRNLRGEKMEDVIFLGTHNRKPTGFASVSLTIDNTDRQLAVDADDVTITRRLYRSGESEYRINKTAVRLKDITELLMDTGLGRDGYSIIGQGRIEEIVSSKPGQRREIFEEAAGISKYRYRKAEAEKKLENAYENLLRLKDIMGELEGRGAAAGAVGKGGALSGTLQRKKDAGNFSLGALDGAVPRPAGKAGKRVSAGQKQLRRHRGGAGGAQLRIQDGYEKVQELAVQIDRCQQQVSQMKNEQADCDAQIAVAQNDLHHNANAIEETHGQILTYTENKDDFKGRLKENQQELRIKQEQLQKAQADESQARQEILLIEEELAALNTEIAQMKGQRAAYEQDITRQKLNRVSSAALLEETLPPHADFAGFPERAG